MPLLENIHDETRHTGKAPRRAPRDPKQQTMLINHYGLNVMDPQARSFLTKNLEAFLFKAGHGEDVDTTKQGTINW